MRGTDLVERLGELVSCESPPGSAPHLTTCAKLLASWGEQIFGRAPQWIVRDGLPHLLWSAPDQRVLLLGHFDTVWPAGTIRQWPFSITQTTATGPGVCDMKGGIVQMFAALAGLPDPSRVGLLLTCDEETGSATSREIIEQEALRSGAVLVGEPSTPDGALKVARKGGSLYRIGVRGRAAHAGVEPHLGVNATVEAALQVLAIGALASTPDGTSVTPTVLTSGTTTNTVPESATVCVDVRSWTREELQRVDRRMRELTAVLPDATVTIDGGVNRYPMPAEHALPLLELAQRVAKDLGLPAPDGAYAPGASDGNFTGALGVPTLDGLGAVGGRPHARGEYIDVSQMADRAALLGGLVERLVNTPA